MIKIKLYFIYYIKGGQNIILQLVMWITLKTYRYVIYTIFVMRNSDHVVYTHAEAQELFFTWRGNNFRNI